MEPKGYRDVMADLIATFGQGAWITISPIAQYDGNVDVRTIRKRYGIPKHVKGMNRAMLARKICELANGGKGR